MCDQTSRRPPTRSTTSIAPPINKLAYYPDATEQGRLPRMRERREENLEHNEAQALESVLEKVVVRNAFNAQIDYKLTWWAL